MHIQNNLFWSKKKFTQVQIQIPGSEIIYKNVGNTGFLFENEIQALKND